MSKQLIILATQNSHKVVELESLLGDGPWQINSLGSLENCADIKMPNETGLTFTENAGLKAQGICAQTDAWVLADDSGLCVDALGGAPGVLSARYARDPGNDARNNDRLVADMVNLSPERRGAEYICVLALARPAKPTIYVEGACRGTIRAYARGTGGFGYDPYFWLPEKGQTMAELTPAQKNAISHRAVAASEMRERLLALIGNST